MYKIAAVVISNCTRKFDKEYHYIIPCELKDAINTGNRVIVPFGKGNRHVEGYVFDIIEKSEIEGFKEDKGCC